MNMVNVALSQMESMLRDNLTDLSKSNKGSIVTLSAVGGAISKASIYFKELDRTTAKRNVKRNKHNFKLNELSKKLIRYV